MSRKRKLLEKQKEGKKRTDRQDKIQTFFGPGVQADIQKTNEVAQMCTHRTSGAVNLSYMRLMTCVYGS